MNEYTKEQRKKYLEEMFEQVRKTHLCGNYINIDDHTDVEWYTNSDAETFVAFTDYGTYIHHYDWDFGYDSNLEAFVEDVIQFVLSNKEKERSHEKN